MQGGAGAAVVAGVLSAGALCGGGDLVLQQLAVGLVEPAQGEGRRRPPKTRPPWWPAPRHGRVAAACQDSSAVLVAVATSTASRVPATSRKATWRSVWSRLLVEMKLPSTPSSMRSNGMPGDIVAPHVHRPAFAHAGPHHAVTPDQGQVPLRPRSTVRNRASK